MPRSGLEDPPDDHERDPRGGDAAFGAGAGAGADADADAAGLGGPGPRRADAGAPTRLYPVHSSPMVGSLSSYFLPPAGPTRQQMHGDSHGLPPVVAMGPDAGLRPDGAGADRSELGLPAAATAAPYVPLQRYHMELAVAVMLVGSLGDANAAVRLEAVMGLGRLLSQPHHAAVWHFVARVHMQRRSARSASVQ
jgi:hypothetical protein